MVKARLAALALGAIFCATAPAEAPYRLERCAQFKDGVALRFVDTSGAQRRVYLSPRGVELGGNAKGFARLSQVKELVLQPVFGITYTSGARVDFGPIDAACQGLLQEVAAPLVHIKA